MSTFLLIHGAWGVAREWDGVVAALSRLGHRGIAVDLPIDDPNAGLEEYADCIVEAAKDEDDPLIVVGHSAGGHAAALIPGRRPVRKLVFLAAFVPQPERSFLHRAPGQTLGHLDDGDFALASRAFRSVIVEKQAGLSELDPYKLAAFLAGERAADLLVPMLRPLLRPHALRAFEQPFPRTALPSIPSAYLLTTADPVLPPASQRLFAARLGVAPIELSGADHGVHIKRPRLVAEVLSRIA